MKETVISILLTVGFLMGFGQTDTTAIPFVSYWNVGDSYDFRITKIQKQYKEGQIVKNDSSTYLANFSVIDSTNSNYKIKWSYKTNFGNIKIPDGLREKLSKYQLTEVIYTTSELGDFVGVENWKEISEMMNDVFSDIVDFASISGQPDKETLQKAMLPIMNVYSSKEGIEQLVLKELYYFHFPFGLEYIMDKPIEYQEELPNIFGGNPVKGDTKIYLKEVDVDNSFCVLIQEMRLNPDDTREMMIGLFNRMGLKEDDEIKNVMQTANVEITDYNRFEYWYYPGIPYRIEAKRESVIDVVNEKGKRIDITRIEIVE